MTAVVLPACALPLVAAEIPVVADYEATLARSRVAEAMSEFGDSTSLYDGSTTFSVTPVSLPGNSRLPVDVTYVLRAYDKEFKTAFKFNLETPYLSGVYKTGQGWVITGSNPLARCSFSGGMPQPPEVDNSDGKPERFFTEEYWHGVYLNLPAESPQLLQIVRQDDAQKPTDGATYKWVTQDRWYFSCIDAIASGGEGFVGHSPDGLKYYFDRPGTTGAWDAVVKQAELGGKTVLQRTELALRASRVEDAYGNWVAYQYSGNDLVGVTASDGRSIQVSAGQITANGRTWGVDTANGLSISYPDGSNYSATIANNVQWTSWNTVSCGSSSPMKNFSGTLGVNIKLRSGVTGSFLLGPVVTGQSAVPLRCNSTDGSLAGPHAFRRGLALTLKTVSGAGVQNAQWNYGYGSNGCFSGASRPGAVMCAANESGTRIVDVAGPTARRRLTFSNKYEADGGQLLSEQILNPSGQVMRTTSYTYQRFGGVGIAGFSAGGDTTGYTQSWVQASKNIQQDGVAYQRAVSQFDSFFRPVRIVAGSNPGSTRTDQLTYFDDRVRWNIGQPATSTNLDTGRVASQVDYDGNGLPWKTWAFGKLVQTANYNPNATLASVTDGNGNTTQLLDWYRGIPRTVRFADATSRSVTVDDNGWIMSITDENGYARTLQYDAMGRLRELAYPGGDGTNWNNWTSAFRPLSAADARPAGIADGQWVRVESVGNYRKLTYYDGYWRPLVVNEYDNGNVSATSRSSSSKYDPEGRVTFASYPVAGSSGGGSGLRTTYDALGRVTLLSADSELGLLNTSTTFNGSGGYNTLTRNPNGAETRTWYQTFDAPDIANPSLIMAPEGQITEIGRDVFGKVLNIKRNDAGGTTLLQRYYVFDASQQLCKAVEPETGATVMAYDGAGNLSWSAAGLSLTGAASCDTEAAANAAGVIRRVYDARNRIVQLAFPQGQGDQRLSYWPDGLVRQISTMNGGVVGYNSYAYNRRRLLTGEAQGQADGPTLTIGYLYDANGNLSGHKYPNGEIVAYEPNALGQPTRAGTYATAATYFASGGLRQFTYGNGVQHAGVQNGRLLLDSLQDTYGGTALFDEGYVYDLNGNVAAITDGATNRNQRGNRTMSYDARDRLTAVTSPMFGAAQYGYDVLDNLSRVVIAGRDQYYCYDANWRLSNIKVGGCNGSTVIGLGYDAQGNLINKNGRLYNFDAGNRLRSAEDKEIYRYDGRGLRTVVSRGSDAIVSMYDVSGALRFKRDGQKNVDTAYIALGDASVAEVDWPIGPQSRMKDRLSWAAQAGAARYMVEESADGVTWTVVYEGADTSWTSLPRPAGTYSYRVSACAAGGACQGVASFSHDQQSAVDIVPLLYQLLLN